MFIKYLQWNWSIKHKFKKTSGRGGGVLPEKFGGGVRPDSQNPYPLYDHNRRFFPLPYLLSDQKFDTIFMTVVADTVALNIIFEGVLFMVSLIMMKR